MSEKGFLNSIAAFLISVLSGLGVGSGGLLVAYLVSTGQGGGEVRAANLFFFIICALSASIMNVKSRKFYPRLIFMISALGIVGCACGVYISSFFSPELMKKIFGWMLIVSGVYATLSGIVVKSNKKTA